MHTSKFKSQRFFETLAMIIALVCVVNGTLYSQTTTSNIRGYVIGASGAPVSDAQVIARMPATNETRGTTTNAAGFYYLGGLRPGSYEITIRRVGVAPQTRAATLRIGETVDLNVSTSDVATQLATVEVASARTGTTTKTSEVGTNITREQISNLPNFERNVLDLAKLTPGVSAQEVNSTDKVLASGGQPPEAVNIFVDGASYKNDVLRGGVVGQDASKGNPLPQGAIDQFRVITQNYKAEYQKAASVIIVATTKSGTNTPEADIFAYGIGKAYVAKDALTARRGGARPNYQRVQAGGNIGGPLIRDKLFYFGTYELNFRNEPAYILLGGDTTFAPASLVATLRPFTGQQAQEFREHLGLAKLTFNASERNTFDGSFTIRKDDDFRGFGGQTAFEAAENLRVTTYTPVLSYKHAGDRWLNEAQASAQFFTWNPTARNFTTVGQNYFGLLRIGGKDTDQDFQQNRFTLRDDVTRGAVSLGGEHTLKMGAGVDFLSYTGTKFFVGNPVFNFRRAPENWATPFEAQTGFGDPTIKKNNVQFGGYVQDDWSISRALVLNLGLRWDAETNMINNDYVTPLPLADSLRTAYANGILVVAQPQPTGPAVNVPVIQELGGIERYITTGKSTRPMYKKAFQPRLGASYSLPDDKTVLFGGAGLYYDRNYWNTLFDEQFRRQFQVITIGFSNTCTPGQRNCAAWDPKYFDPAQLRALGSAVGAPEVFLVANDMVPPRTFQFSAGVRRSLGASLLTLSYNGLRGRNFMNFVRGGPGFGGYAAVFVADDRVKTWYDAMQLQLQRPLIGMWGGSLAYTLSKSTEQGQSQDLFWGFDDRFPTVGDRPRRVAPGDQRHAIVASGIVRLPYDFLFSSIVNLGTGIAVNASDKSQGFGPYQNRSYIFQPPTRAFLGIGHVFATQNMDIRLQKDIDFASSQTAAIVVDVFNVFKSENFGCYNTDINPPSQPNTNYGQPGCAALGRRLQLGIRYGFHPAGGVQ
ncbi:MAG TPA: carboxypeptidase regulatory-like domain-containing protein [Gemmatimonadaceae bacterium]|nr:carboxypeptidase regulatory-like domain-containing protein [Gemmatimonadaceae bacterium]